MRKIALLACGLVLLWGGIALAHVAEHRAGLRGDKVVPGPGDPDAAGRARIRSAPDAQSVCYRITFNSMAKPTSGHIHAGASGEQGEKVVKLFSSQRGKSSPIEGCRHGVTAATIERFHDNPSYVDLHNERYPDGAVRGQLRLVD